MKRNLLILPALISLLSAGCTETAASSYGSQTVSCEHSAEASASSADSLSSSGSSVSDSSSADSQYEPGDALAGVEIDPLHHFHAGKKVGQRIRLTLDQACLKKNQDEQFVLMYIKDDCEYCAAFDEVLNPYLKEHPLTIYEVDLTQAEQMYLDEDREAMLNILSAGVSRTPALYYVESQTSVYLLDHTTDNYSADGLNQWVEKYDLEKLK